MRKSAQVSLLKSVDTVKSSLSITEKIKTRRAKELVLAFCGSVGSGVDDVADRIRNELEQKYQYEVVKIKVSELIKKYITKVDHEFDASLSDSAQRYIKLQDAGNKLREHLGNGILGQFTIEAISLDREKRTLATLGGGGTAETGERSSHRVAYLIDSLKHPEEVDILRAVYRNMFFLFGVFCPEEKRRKNLINEDMKSSDASLIMERDEKQEEEFGQQLTDTLQYADFFINNDHPNIESIDADRFLNLILGAKIISPTKDEFAMFIAQSAALRSECLSRQIGAAILSKDGEIIATGYNDVPKKGGGLYSCEDKKDDFRCINLGSECQSDKYKGKIKAKIQEILSEELPEGALIEKIATRIGTESRINDLIEFSRAVHAEMEAILAAARNGISPKGGTLYCTTFPCHNCARHILSAGIRKVLFIEPYAKSLTMKLYGEDITLEPPLSQQGKEVIISHFEGVAPRQFLNLFKAKKERKKQGKGIIIEPGESIPVLPEYIDSWTDVEAKVVEDLRKRLESIG